jgi:hypothetical protein
MLNYCILRPTVQFGKEDVLINNIPGRCGTCQSLAYLDRRRADRR